MARDELYLPIRQETPEQALERMTALMLDMASVAWAAEEWFHGRYSDEELRAVVSKGLGE